jgi:hypothetical protein
MYRLFSKTESKLIRDCKGGEMRNEYNILAGKPEGKRPFERPRRGWEIGWEGVDWMHLA